MTEFLKYPHLEKVGHPEVQDLPLGLTHVFPKIDGSNGCVWFDGNGVLAASRKRVLSPEQDNAGFFQWLMTADPAIVGAAREAPGLRFYGEWLVPHTFKGYRPEAWRRFYVFDVWDDAAGHFLPHEQVAALSEAHGFDHIPPLAVVDHPTEEQLLGLLEENTFLCQDGAGPGEGIVLKRYDFRNRFGRITWAKMVRAEFKDRHKVEMPVRPSQNRMTIERDAVERYVTEAFVAKERAKVELALWQDRIEALTGAATEHPEEWLASREARKHLIPRLLQTAYYELVREHAWDFAGKRGRTVDFNLLRRMTQERVKAFCKDLF